MAKVIILCVDEAECSGATQANARDKNHAYLRTVPTNKIVFLCGL